MYRLSVKAGPVVNDSVTVAWADQKAKGFNGKLSIDFSREEYRGLTSNDKQIVAELTAIRHLLFRRKIWSSGIESGVGQGLLLTGEKVELTVSKGGIKRLARQDSHKHFLVPHVYYLVSRLCGVTILVSKQDPATNAKPAEPEYAIIRPYESPYEPVMVQSIGAPLVITKHAYNRFAQPGIYPYDRTQGDKAESPKYPCTTLMRSVRRKKGAMCIPVPDKVLRHKQRKYKNGGNEEHWALVATDLVMIVADTEDAPGVKTVITVYRRRQDERKFA